MIRPPIGHTTVKAIYNVVCSMCGAYIPGAERCSPDCDFDGDPIDIPGRAFYEVYRRVDVYLGDREITQKNDRREKSKVDRSDNQDT